MKKIPKCREFQRWTNATLKYIPKKILTHYSEVTIRIIGKKEGAQLNTVFRGKKKPTNVLSFSYPDQKGLKQESLGDIAICASVVSEEAKKQLKETKAHWVHLTIHGILHLLDYDHIKKSDAKIMERLEIKILNDLGVENPYER